MSSDLLRTSSSIVIQLKSHSTCIWNVTNIQPGRCYIKQHTYIYTMSINREKQMTIARSATKFYTPLLIPNLSVLLQQSNLQVFHTYYIFTYQIDDHNDELR